MCLPTFLLLNLVICNSLNKTDLSIVAIFLNLNPRGLCSNKISYLTKFLWVKSLEVVQLCGPGNEFLMRLPLGWELGSNPKKTVCRSWASTLTYVAGGLIPGPGDFRMGGSSDKVHSFLQMVQVRQNGYVVCDPSLMSSEPGLLFQITYWLPRSSLLKADF